MFELVSSYQPAGDQPQAIAKLTEGLLAGAKHQTLLGVTGSGKTEIYLRAADEVIKRADTAMYQAKEAGGNSILFSDS